LIIQFYNILLVHHRQIQFLQFKILSIRVQFIRVGL